MRPSQWLLRTVVAHRTAMHRATPILHVPTHPGPSHHPDMGCVNEAVGVEDWRVLFGGACALFRTGSFAVGVALVDAIGRLATDANHHPDIDLRPH